MIWPAPGWRSLAWELVRVGLAAVFLYASVAKWSDPSGLAANIVRFRILPEALIHPVALGLPPLEFLVGVGLLFGRWKRQAAFACCALFMIFLGAMVSASVRGIEIECACFGAAMKASAGQAMVRNSFLLLASLAVYWRLLAGRTMAASHPVPGATTWRPLKAT